MITCAVYGCTNNTSSNTDPGIQYYYFPKHPVFAQQWVRACWRSDAIDIDNAQICSVHFDNNCYLPEFKVVDYMVGHYTRMLKYDAMPTLYLPNLADQVILKNTLEQQPVTFNITTTNNQNDVKNVVIYNVTFDTPASYQQTVTPISSDLKFRNINIPTCSNSPVDHEKIHMQKLQNLKDENESLKQNVTTIEDTIRNLEMQLSEKTEALDAVDEQLKNIMMEYDILRRSRMTYARQKNILSKVFSESQLKILSGRKKIYWSNDDMAMGYTIWHLSNKRCYLYLKKNLNIPLPAYSSIRRWETLKKHESLDDEIKDIKCKDENNT